MRNLLNRTSLSVGELLLAVAILIGAVGVLVYLLPTPILVLGGAIILLSILIYSIGFFSIVRQYRFLYRLNRVPILVVFLAPVILTFIFIRVFNLSLSVANWVILIALLLSLATYWLIVPAALYQQLREQQEEAAIEGWSSVCVLVPAYNEEGYVGECIESLLAIEYPTELLDIVVIDDGSTDNTYQEAANYESDGIRILQKENAGKHSALNYGIERTSSKFIVCIDADSVVDTKAVKELIRTYRTSSNVGAIAGNVEVANADSFITRIQALEYIIGINMFRRALSLLGLVKVVPGCLGMFDRKLVNEIGGYSGDTVTEDFDLTIGLLKGGHKIYHSSNAVAQTEVPDTWSDLYRQRIRWFRGNVQTVLKHWQIFKDTDFGILHVVMAPYLILSMIVIPGLGFVISAYIIWMLFSGAIIQLIGLLVLFTLLQVLFCTLAILIEDDDLSLVKYAPLTVIGYKQFLDVILAKGTLDVILKDSFSWTRAQRIRQRETTDENRITDQND